MTASGRILVIEERACPETSLLWDKVRDEGYEVVAMPLGQTLERTAVAQRPDVVLLNMIAADLANERGRYLDAASRLRVALGGRKLPVIGIGETGEVARPFGMADVLPRPLSAGRLLGRIASLSRLATMQAELRRRIETGGRFGMEVPHLETAFPDRDASLLVIGRGDRFLKLEAALSRMGTLTGAFTAATARDYLTRRSFDAVILDLPLDEATALTEEFRRNPTWFALPIVAFAGHADEGAIEDAHRSGLTDLIAEPFDPRDLLERVSASVSENRLRDQLKTVYAQARHFASSDALTGLYARGYLMEHLQQFVREARRSGERFAIIGFRLADLAGLNRQHGYAAGDHILRQVGILIARLARGEDLAARLSGGRFVLILPGAGYEDAVTCADRIAAIIHLTRVMVPGLEVALNIEIETGHAIWTARDDAESLIARAFGPQAR
jgi:diguanylate cyclase (GGDEF)-like protein